MAVLRHELANALNGMLGMTEVLAGSRLTVEQRQWLCAIASSGRQMQSLIGSGLPDRALPSPNALKSSSRIDGVQLLEQVLISNTPAALARGNHLLLIMSPGLARQWSVNACLLRQVLENLVANAIKFTVDGVITIQAVSVTPDDGGRKSLRLMVRDSGPGFDPAEAQRIFTAYAQLGERQADRPESRGLGLHICKELVRTLRGSISCANRAAGGASFEVVLPGVLPSEKAPPDVVGSVLLERLCCRLDLTNPLRRSVEGFLSRLGVRLVKSMASLPDTKLCLAITEKNASTAGVTPGLLLTPYASRGKAPPVKAIEVPVLESRLGRVLLELALEWHRLASGCEPS